MNLLKRLGGRRATWRDDNHLIVNGVCFFVVEDLKDLYVKLSSDQMLLGKCRSMVEAYVRLTEHMAVRNMFELGIYRGGSSAFFHALYQPRKLVAIDLEPERAPDLDTYIQNTSCAESLTPYYNVNQGDRDRMEAILREEFPDGELDLVVDDASHMLAETTSSFNVLFPRVRPGGLYIIEDWSWAHAPHERWQKADGQWNDKPALSHLIFEIILSCASTPDLIEDITVNKNMVFVKRGARPVDPETFKISTSYLARGREFKPVL